MTHLPTKAHIAASLQKRIDKLAVEQPSGLEVIEEFGMFIDTHRDQPHVGSFASDIHRGHCLPTLVDYIAKDDMLRVHEPDGKFLQRHDKHLFITQEEWSTFLLNYLMVNGEDPRDGSGSLPTSHFRDPRKKLYLLKSFRQMVGEAEKRA